MGEQTTPAVSSRKSPYRDYCRPKLADLLAALGLDVEYRAACGAYLTTATGEPVTDYVGGFGAALLGHNHPELKRLVIELLEADTPHHAQVSSRAAAGELAQRLSELLPGRTGYVTQFSNSGTEAIEAALKHAYKVHLDRVRDHFEEIARETNELYQQMTAGEISVALPRGKKPVDFRDDLDQHNLAQFEAFQKHPVVLAFLGSFHGKTSSSLKLTYNQSFREGFEGLSAIETEFIAIEEPERSLEIVAAKGCNFLRPTVRANEVALAPAPISRVIAFVFEPIQGEGGIRPLPERTMAWLADNRRRLGVPLIIDEIQTGCGRTGSFFAFAETALARAEPEYVVLSKALGGGLVKIAATLIRADLLDHDFGILHTSTFGEDDFSCRVASRVVDMLTRDGGALLAEVRRKGSYFQEQLEGVRAKYPELVHEVRGRGLMLGVEFTDLAEQSPFFRAAGRQGILSILLASYLLRHHRVRVLGPLTNLLKGNPGRVRRSVLRLQPPVCIELVEIDRFIAALDEALALVRANDEALLIGHLMGWTPNVCDRTAPRQFRNQWPVEVERRDIDARIGFILHPTDLAHVREYYFPSLAGRPVADDALQQWWHQICRFLEPVHVRRQAIVAHGFTVEANLVMIPHLPAAMVGDHSRRHRKELTDKIQDAVTVAKELGDDNIPVSMVGLGAYTSIATCNGLTLNDHEMAVTTGNAYTAALTLDGVAHAAQLAGVDMAQARVAVLGAGGNIGQILAQFLAGSCRSLELLGGHRHDSLVRLQATQLACAAECGSGPCARVTCHSDTEILRECDVVIVATNSPDRNLLRPEQLKSGAVVCCTSLPSNLSDAFATSSNRVFAFDGGLARLPEASTLDFVGLPRDGLSFGCLAETLLLGFDGHNHSFCKGRVTIAQVKRTREMAALHGFALGALRFGDHPLLAELVN